MDRLRSLLRRPRWLAPCALSVLALALSATHAVETAAQADERKGLPAPDPRAKARESVRWFAPSEWKALEPREGESQAFRLRRTLPPAPPTERGEARGTGAAKAQGNEVLKAGPRLVIHYLGPQTPRRELAPRQAGWARRFLSPERKRLEASAAKTQALSNTAPKLKIHLVELRGDYSAVLSPGQEPRPPQRDWTGLYAHVVAPDGVWALVLLGPTKQISPWRAALVAFLRAAKTGNVLIRPDPRERRDRPQPTPQQNHPTPSPSQPAPTPPARPAPSANPKASPGAGAR